MILYYHAIWKPSPTWANGHQYGAPAEAFERALSEKVKELGPPFLVWKSREGDGTVEASPDAPDGATVLRALRQFVHEDKRLTLDEAWALCDLFGLPRSEVAESTPLLPLEE